ncbi:Protein kinase domain containing protein [Ditylenchus destructor]|nr:Protein kinase domain containing protein [Ditylenchus destructor]
MKTSVEIEETLCEVLKETYLFSFETKLALEKQLTRLDHFNDVTDDELQSYGLSNPVVRRRLGMQLKSERRQLRKANYLAARRKDLLQCQYRHLTQTMQPFAPPQCHHHHRHLV